LTRVGAWAASTRAQIARHSDVVAVADPAGDWSTGQVIAVAGGVDLVD
jgi:hypothetical protein